MSSAKNKRIFIANVLFFFETKSKTCLKTTPGRYLSDLKTCLALQGEGMRGIAADRSVHAADLIRKTGMSCSWQWHLVSSEELLVERPWLTRQCFSVNLCTRNGTFSGSARISSSCSSSSAGSHWPVHKSNINDTRVFTRYEQERKPASSSCLNPPPRNTSA